MANSNPVNRWSFRSDLPQVKETGLTGIKTARTPADVRAICADMATIAQESFVCLDLNAKNGVIDRRLVTLGIADASLVHPREVFRGAILNCACAVIVSHNHPSGDATPSAEDVRVTRQLVDAGQILGIRVLDHVVIGRGERDHVSLRESGLVEFSK